MKILLASAMTLLPALAAAQDVPLILPQFFPPETFDVIEDEMTIDDGVESLSVLHASTPYVKIRMNQPVLSRNGLDVRLTAPGAILEFPGLDRISITLSNLEMTMPGKRLGELPEAGMPEIRSDVVSKDDCLPGLGFSSINARRAVIAVSAPSDSPVNTGVIAEKFIDATNVLIGFEAAADCTLIGTLSATTLNGNTGDTSFMAEGPNVAFNMPGSWNGALRGPPASTLSADARLLSILDKSGYTMQSLRNVKASAVAESASIAPLPYVLNRAMQGGAALDRLPFDIWNLFHVARMDLEVASTNTQTHLTTVMPVEAMANYSRAGVSSVNADLGFSMKKRGPDARVDVSASVIGIGNLVASASLTTAPVSIPEPIEGSVTQDRSERVVVSAADLTWKDTGFSRVVETLYGGPPSFMLINMSDPVAGEGESSSALTRIVRGARQHLLSYFGKTEPGRTFRTSMQFPKMTRLSHILNGSAFKADAASPIAMTTQAVEVKQ